MASFDVFDTILTRSVGDPTAVARLVAARLLTDGLADVGVETWHAARVRCEQDLFLHRHRSPTLEEIHREVATRLGYDGGRALAAMDVELDVEREVARLVPGANALIARARSARPSGSIVYVSDTPLSGAFLIELLSSFGVWDDGDRCFTSADVGKTKATGTLFDAVARELGVDAGQITHVGDNRMSDVGRSRLAGWTARHREVARLNRYELILEGASAASDGYASRLAGASRLSRLEAVERGIHPALAAVAAGVAAPMLVGFLHWVLHSSRTAGLQRLYFLARDGQILHLVARLLASSAYREIDCRYLYVSRRSMGMIDDGSGHDRHDSIALLEYLRSAGFADGDRTGIVDVGWRGEANRVLTDHIVASGGKRPVAYFNVGLVEAAAVADSWMDSRQHGWLFDYARGRGVTTRILGQVALVEMFCGADHGSVVGYRCADDDVRPVLAETQTAAAAWGLHDLRWVVERFVHHLDLRTATTPPDLRHAVWGLLVAFWDRPTASEVRFWADYPMEFGEAGRIGPIGQAVGTLEGMRRMIRGRGELRPHESWLMGTASRSALPIALALRARHWWHRHGGRVSRIPDRMSWEIASRSAVAGRLARLLERR